MLVLTEIEMQALRALLEHQGCCKTLAGDFASPNRRNAAFLRNRSVREVLRRLNHRLEEISQPSTGDDNEHDRS